MNELTLIGFLRKPVTYYCTAKGQDLVRFEICTTVAGKEDFHHCIAWGPAALDLHQYLVPGDRLLLKGVLQYRIRSKRNVGAIRVPEIQVKAYTYLGPLKER